MEDQQHNCAVPDWVSKTPHECEYCLTMFDSSGMACEDINVSREEFIALKEHLARMRGFLG